MARERFIQPMTSQVTVLVARPITKTRVRIKVPMAEGELSVISGIDVVWQPHDELNAQRMNAKNRVLENRLGLLLELVVTYPSHRNKS